MDMALSPVVLFLLSLCGHAGNDVVSLMPAEDYFQSRKIDVTVDKMMELAAKDPTDARTSIQQLLALRVLAEEPAKTKKADGFAAMLKILEDIAAGKKAQDKLGFSKEYAAWAAASLTEKQLPQPPPGSKLVRALDWFPQDVGLALAMDFNGSRQFGQTKEVRELSHFLAKQLPAKLRSEIYDVVEQLGNVRIDRMAVGFVPRTTKAKERLYYRFSGKVDHELLSAFLQKTAPRKVEKAKGPMNEPIMFLGGGGPRSVVDMPQALVGNTDFLMIRENDGDRDDFSRIKHMLEVRAGDKNSVHKGLLANEIKKVSAKANAVILSATGLPGDLGDDFGPPRGPFSSLPGSILFEVERNKDGMDFRFEGKMPKKENAKAFIEDVLKLRGQAMIKMKLDKDSPVSFDGLLKTLGTLKMEAKEETVTATMRLSNEVIAGYVSAFVKLAKGQPNLK